MQDITTPSVSFIKQILPVILIFIIATPLIFASDFDDVSDEHQKVTAINYVKNKGIFEGYDDGTFKPENKIIRAELTKVLVLAAPEVTEPQVDAFFKENYLDKEYTYAYFPDVSTNEWYAKYIAFAQDKGWIAGYPDGTFHPAQEVNFVEALKMVTESNGTLLEGNELYSSMKQQRKEDFDTYWYMKYLLSAHLRDVITINQENECYFSFVSSEKMPADYLVTRGDIAELLFRFGIIEDTNSRCYKAHEDDWQTYTDPDRGFLVTYPPSWETQTLVGGTEEFTGIEGDGEYEKKIFFKDAYTEYPYYIQVFVPDNEEETIAEYISLRDPAKSLGTSDITINGINGTYFYDRNDRFGPQGVVLENEGVFYHIVSNATNLCDTFQTIYMSFTL